MSWTYTNDPENVELDALRVLIGDVLSEDPQLTDQELNHFLAQTSSVDDAGLLAARFLQALYARKVDKSVGDLSISYSQRAAQYAALAKTLERKLATSRARPYAGGLTKTQRDAVAADTDFPQPAFTRDQFSRDPD